MKHPSTFLAFSLLLPAVFGCATMDENPKHQSSLAAKTESPALARQESTKSLKPKVAIARFSNETRYGQSFLIDKGDNRLGKQAMDILSGKLIATGKFFMLERANIEQWN